MNQQRPGDGLTIPGAFNILYLALGGHATCFTVFTRHSFGREALGINGVAAVAILFLYSSCYPYSRGVIWFFGLWFIALVLQRIRTLWINVRGRWVHSHCSGYPWLGHLVPFVHKYKTAVFIELIALFFTGIFLIPIDQPLAQFLMVGAWSVVIKTGIDEEIERRRLFRMRDAEIEQRTMVERYRSGDF